MASLLCPGVPFYRNPQLRPGLAALVAFLMDRRYDCSPVRWTIYDHVAVNDTLEGSLIEPEDMAEAEAVFVDALPEVAADADAWDRQDVLFDSSMLAAGTHPWPIPAIGDDDRPAPICGGGFEPDEDERAWASEAFAEPEPYCPTAGDLAEMRAHFDRVDQVLPMYGYE
jgi:hypothetical protein